MENKLKVLTDTLYEEGVEKGRKEAEEIVSKAKEEAKKIMDDAKKEYESILHAAKQECEQLKIKTNSDIVLASKQLINQIKTQITEMLVSKMLDKNLKESFSDKKFVQGLCLALMEKLGDKTTTLKFIFPDDWKNDMMKFIEDNYANYLKDGMEFHFKEDVNRSFCIMPKDGSFVLDFGENSFSSFLGDYLRPLTKKIIFKD